MNWKDVCISIKRYDPIRNGLNWKHYGVLRVVFGRVFEVHVWEMDRGHQDAI